MTHPRLLKTATIAALSALLACGESSNPVGPEAAGDQPRLAPEFAWASNSWTTRAPMPSGRKNLAVGVVDNSAGEAILYALGGWATGTFSDVAYKIEAYNYATNTWTTKTATLSVTRTNGVGVIGGKLYISGGGAHTGEGFESFKTLFVYDPVADVLVRKADMPRPISDGITGVIGGRLYVLTGVCGDCADFMSRRFYRYDPTTNTWAFLPWVPRAHVGGVGGVINGKFYVAGGFNGSSTTNLDAYDPATNRWTARAPLPVAVTAAAAAVLNNKLYVIGGGVGPLEESVTTVYAYDPVTNTWQTKASMPTARRGLAAAAITAFGNSKILAIGGEARFSADPKPNTANEAYKP